uniref:Uncharacterized protein n=1 Tax=Arundo donax TaxID=35708 RepID=A0A0A9G8A1_ARUDO
MVRAAVAAAAQRRGTPTHRGCTCGTLRRAAPTGYACGFATRRRKMTRKRSPWKPPCLPSC